MAQPSPSPDATEPRTRAMRRGSAKRSAAARGTILNVYKDIYIDGNDSPSDAFHKLTDAPVGYTLGRAAKIIGISKPAVHQAIEKGALLATRMFVMQKGEYKLLSIEIDRDSVHEYAHARNGRDRVPKGFIASQQPLPL